MASAALRPRSGYAEAWASLPVKRASKWLTAKHGMRSSSFGAGCTIKAALTLVEAAPLEHQDLPAAALLGRRAEDTDRDGEVVRELGQGKAGADGARRDDVVPARMADLGKGVVLRTDRDRERPGARGRGNAVGSPQIPGSTTKPPSLRASAHQAEARSSSNASSG